jgi:hypothetical protein
MIETDDSDSSDSQYDEEPSPPSGKRTETAERIPSSGVHSSLSSGHGTPESTRSAHASDQHIGLKKPTAAVRSHSRSPSPSPSLSRRGRSRHLNAEDKDLAPRFIRQAKEEKQREDAYTKRLLYVLVARCIAFPILPRPKVDRSAHAVKLSKPYYEEIMSKVTELITGSSSQSVEGDFRGTLALYRDKVLRCPHVQKLAEDGALSTLELKQVFGVLSKRMVERMAEVALDEGIQPITSPHEEVVSSWMSLVEQHCLNEESRSKERGITFRSGEDNYSQTELYALFQEVLGVSAFDHQEFSRTAQLNDRDDQESILRRELQQWKEKFQKTESFKLDFAVANADMNSWYREEMKQKVSDLTSKLDSRIFCPDTKGKKSDHRPDLLATSIPKSEIKMNLDLRVTILEGTGVKELSAGKPFFITFETDTSTTYKTQSVKVTSDYVRFAAEATFAVTSPVPEVKIQMYNTQGGFMSDGKVLAKNVIHPYPVPLDKTTTIALNSPHSPAKPKIKISIDFKRPPNMTKCGFLYCQGTTMFHTWKRRFFAIVQFSEYRFLLCHFKPKNSHPKQFLVLEGFVADVAGTKVPLGEQAVPKDGEFQFALVKEDARFQFGTDKDKDQTEWVKALYRATGQTHQPSMRATGDNGRDRHNSADNHRLVDLAATKVVDIDHNKFYRELCLLCLQVQMRRDEFSRGLLSEALKYVLDEYVRRYFVRSTEGHLTHLEAYLAESQKGHAINPALLYYVLVICGNATKGIMIRKEGIPTVVLKSDIARFKECCRQVDSIFSCKVRSFCSCFPFGAPKNDLQNAIKLVEFCVETTTVGDIPGQGKKHTTHVLNGYMRDAALQVYQEMWEGSESAVTTTPDLRKLADMCMECMDDVLTFYAEEFGRYPEYLGNFSDSFWTLFERDMKNVLATCKVCDDLIAMFIKLNKFLSDRVLLRKSKFHSVLEEEFFPITVQRFDDLNRQTAFEIQEAFKKETWTSADASIPAVSTSIKLLVHLRTYLSSIQWPSKELAHNLESTCSSLCNEQLQDCRRRIMFALSELLKKYKITGEIPSQLFAMLNSLWEVRLKTSQLCGQPLDTLDSEHPPYHGDVEENITQDLKAAVNALVDKVHEPLEELTRTLSGYGESSGFSFLKKLKSPTWSLPHYLTFVETLLGKMREHLLPEIMKLFLVQWYSSLWDRFDDWLRERIEVHLNTEQIGMFNEMLETIPKVCRDHGLARQYLHGPEYNSVKERINIETSSE